MKKIALALAISSALTSHFALAAKGDAEEAPTLKQMEIKTNKELEDNLNKVRGNAGIEFQKDSTVKTEKTANSVPVSDTGVYNALKALDEGRFKKIDEEIRRGNEINARILANAVSGKIDKVALTQAEEKAIASCTKPLVATLTQDKNVKELYKGTPLEKAFEIDKIDTSSMKGLLDSIDKLAKTFDNIKGLATNFSFGKIADTLKGVIPNIDFNKLGSLDTKQLAQVGSKISEFEGIYGKAEQALNSTTTGITTAAYTAIEGLTKEFQPKLETAYDRELFNDAVKRVSEQCGKASKVAESASQGATKQVTDLNDITINTEKARKAQLYKECLIELTPSEKCIQAYGSGTSDVIVPTIKDGSSNVM